MRLTRSKYCRNCGEPIKRTDKYCTYCGELHVYGDFQPRNNVRAMLYGPPYSAKYVCQDCNVSFVVRGLGSAKTRYCPKCGKQCRCWVGDSFQREIVVNKPANDTTDENKPTDPKDPFDF